MSLKADSKHSVNPQLYCLLQSICSLPTLEIVRDALDKAETEQPLSLKAKTNESFKESESITVPTLKCASLSEKQKQIYEQLKEQKFQERLILDALAEVGEDEEKAFEWCLSHEADYKNIEKNSPKTTDKKMIDENHLQVQQLMHDYDYPCEIAIEAVEKANEDFESAMGIAALLIGGGEDDHDLLVNGEVRAGVG